MLRYYTLAACLAATATVLFFRWMPHPTRGTTVALAAAYVGLLYTDYPSSFVIAGHAIALWWMHRRAMGRWLLLLGTCGLLFAPWAAVVVSQVRSLTQGTQTADLNAGPLAIVLKMTYSMYGFLVGETIYPVEPPGLAGIVGLLAAAASFVARKGGRDLRTVEILFPLWATLGILFTSLITTFISRHTSFIYTPPRTFYALPFVFIALGVLNDRLRPAAFRRGTALLLGSVSVYGLFNLAANRHFFMPVYASPWKSIVAHVQGVEGLILSDESQCYAYYARRVLSGGPQLIRPAGVASLREVLESRRDLAGAGTVFVILSERESTGSEIPGDVIEYLHAHGRLVEHRTFLPYDATYRLLKTKVLRRPSGEAKFHLYRFEMPVIGPGNGAAVGSPSHGPPRAGSLAATGHGPDNVQEWA
jgi:hypothetical protein